MSETISAVILSSGLSERMGKPKALLKWNQKTTFIEKIVSEFHRFGCKQIICMINEIIEPVCNKMLVPQNVRFVVNHHPDWGRFYSVRTGLSEVLDSDYCFIHNVDNPFVNIRTIEKLYSERNPETWCSPVYRNKGGHPVLIPGTIIRKIVEVQDLNTTLADMLNLYPKIVIEMDDDSIHRNINTPEDYSKYKTMMQVSGD